MSQTLDKLVHAIEAERGRWGGEGRAAFLDFDMRAENSYDLTAREASGFLRSEKNREILRKRLGAASIDYRPSKYHKASGGGHDVGFVKYRTSPARRDPPSVLVKFGEALEPVHATKKGARQLDREIAAAIAYEATRASGTYYLMALDAWPSDPVGQPLDLEFQSRPTAKRAAMKLVREGVHPRVEVWHRWRGDNYMQGLASKEGWADV